MRLKGFIIFIIIFTIIYFGGFIIYDHFKNKKDEEKNEKKNYELLSIDKLKKFALFYNTSVNIDLDKLTLMYEEFKKIISIPIIDTSSKYGITKDELIVIVEYLEYIGLIKTRSLHMNEDTYTNLNDKEDALVIKFSILFSNKYDYNTILRNAGFGSDKEVAILMEHHLIPGVKIVNNEVFYVGDLDV